jgi:hypothetical protein
MRPGVRPHPPIAEADLWVALWVSFGTVSPSPRKSRIIHEKLAEGGIHDGATTRVLPRCYEAPTLGPDFAAFAPSISSNADLSRPSSSPGSLPPLSSRMRSTIASSLSVSPL